MPLQRLQWVYSACPVCFITACTCGRRKSLACDAIHSAFVKFAGKSVDRHVYVGRYVIMPDHLHLFAAFAPIAPSLSEWIKGLKRVLADELKRGQVHAPYWQKSFFDHVLRSNESYSRKWDYVWQNPVRAGLVSKADDWPLQGEIKPLTMPLQKGPLTRPDPARQDGARSHDGRGFAFSVYIRIPRLARWAKIFRPSGPAEGRRRTLEYQQ